MARLLALFGFFVGVIGIGLNTAQAQRIDVQVALQDDEGNRILHAIVQFDKGLRLASDGKGHYSASVDIGVHTILISAEGYRSLQEAWDINERTRHRIFTLDTQPKHLGEVTIVATRRSGNIQQIKGTKGTTIYAGKKNETISLAKLPANTATNNSRQIYAQVPGINIVENDEAGIALGIATRGLNPNRTTAFNTRQNGYDISADPIGYPETYYTPPADGLSSIEIIRGAASLQYGTQFGGLLNFHFKEGDREKEFGVLSKQTFGSYGFFSSFNSIGGQVGKVNYYGFYNFRRSDGWRANTAFGVHNEYLGINYQLSNKVALSLQYSGMQSNMKQAGGLTDKAFAQNPQQSYRDRNWFNANWNIPELGLQYQRDSNNLFSLKVYGLVANRAYVGNLSKITLTEDLNSPRLVMEDDYRNVFAEARYIHHYRLIGDLKSSLAAGIRFYHGNTHRTQGYNYTGSDADFSLKNQDSLQIDYRFPSWNYAAFAEHLFQVTPKLSITPGVRAEYLQTNGKGYTIPDTSFGQKIFGNERHIRAFPLLGIGIDYQLGKDRDVYANFSQNYSPVNFGDIVIINPGMKVDSALQDVKGYNADLGYRGELGRLIHFDLSLYYLLYKNRIGTLLQTDGSSNVYQFTTNISDSRSLGAELYADIDLRKALLPKITKAFRALLFGSVAFTDARYINADKDPQRKKFQNKYVEYAAPVICRTGLDFGYKRFVGSLQFSYTSDQYSDASNARSSTDGTVGIIPHFHTFDFTGAYHWKHWQATLSINNFTNTRYFTRRTSGFPGPGIIPSEGRALFLSVQYKL